MRGADIRRAFLSFFEERGHTVVPSSSLIPNDPSLLLTTAGMVQFKPYFLGQQEPPYPRAASVQKSFRTTDIENVGRTIRHMTFFEMLGNFSFGDYFKDGAIDLAWELVTGRYGLDPERLWATVYVEDDEAVKRWLEYLPAERIVRRDRPIDQVPVAERGKFDNFWSMGVAGPCGPSSEIFVDRGSRYGPDGGPDASEERYLEIWNLVFMQYERDDDFNIVGELATKGVDTGSGLERVAIVLQDVPSIFETDLLAPILEASQSATGKTYGRDERDDLSLRILTEHGRAVTFLIAVGDAWPELAERKAFVLQVAASEEEHFGATLRQGVVLFSEEVERLKATGERSFPGEAAFLYHDTYGFPVELTAELAEEQGLRVDIDAFEHLMAEQRQRARAAAKGGKDERGLIEVAKEAGPTDFLGYEHLAAEGRVAGLIREGQRVPSAGEGDRVGILLDRTPFYAEGGGQVGDTGVIRSSSGEIRVEDTIPGPAETNVHRGRVTRGEVKAGDDVEAMVDADRRAATMRSHTGTHVLHWTLRHLLGEHARQAGSLVAPGRLRFDFTHFEGLHREDIERIEAAANARLGEDASVRAYETTFEYARSQGALALFGERYGDLVRVVEVGDYSIELCGGTHVPHTGEVQLALIQSEGSIGSGLRRIEALVGPDALGHVHLERRLLEEVAEALGAGDPRQAPERARRAAARIKELEAALGRVRAEERAGRVEELVAGARDVAGVRLVVAELPGEDPGALRELAIKLRDRMERDGHGAAVLGSAEGSKATLVAAVTKPLIDRGVAAPLLIERAAQAVGGRAGGKPHLAFGGGGNPAALRAALEAVPARLAELVGG